MNRSHLAVRFMLGRDMYTWDSDGLIKSDKYFGRLDCGEPTHYAKYPFGACVPWQASTRGGWM